jgi:histidyl-tRNA synthetase
MNAGSLRRFSFKRQQMYNRGNMKLSTQTYKGTRDFYPEDMRVRKWMFDKWRKACESFGYEEYDGPILEPLELFASKTSDEIVNEQTYSFTDRGDRKVVMRPEMTPTVSRMVAAKRQELGYPLRLYSIPNCFRYERPQKGRLREFWQLNADIFGVVGTEADFEIILLADAIMKAFEANIEQYQIQISSRKIIQDVFDELKIQGEKRAKVLNLIDKKEKVDELEWEKLFFEILEDKQAKYILEFLKKEDVPQNAQKVIDRLQSQGITNVGFNRYLARGFDYYTDIVFEVFDTNPDNNRSMFGGGRYDGLVGAFGVEPVPTVGFGMGDATFQNFLESNNLIPELDTQTDIYIATIGDAVFDAQDVAQELRSKGLNVAIDLSGKKLEKQIKTADKKGIKNVLFVGEEELKTNKYKLKNLDTGDEQNLSVNEIDEKLN